MDDETPLHPSNALSSLRRRERRGGLQRPHRLPPQALPWFEAVGGTWSTGARPTTLFHASARHRRVGQSPVAPQQQRRPVQVGDGADAVRWWKCGDRASIQSYCPTTSHRRRASPNLPPSRRQLAHVSNAIPLPHHAYGIAPALRSTNTSDEVDGVALSPRAPPPLRTTSSTSGPGCVRVWRSPAEASQRLDTRARRP